MNFARAVVAFKPEFTLTWRRQNWGPSPHKFASASEKAINRVNGPLVTMQVEPTTKTTFTAFLSSPQAHLFGKIKVTRFSIYSVLVGHCQSVLALFQLPTDAP